MRLAGRYYGEKIGESGNGAAQPAVPPVVDWLTRAAQFA